MTDLAAKIPGTSVAWSRSVLSGTAVDRSGAVTSTAISLLVVFLCLAALYESWTVPIAVLLDHSARGWSAQSSR